MMNNPTFSRAITFLFIAMALCSYGYFIYQTFDGVVNLWIVTTGMLLWLLAVANAKIDELCKPKGE